ncbi:MAG: tRNA pseudouridine(38-40) synthase TruA [Deltaproteobacteria bacterium]|nr:MAG: tRNA pseudouridine(38-40) synthase TruA [Deltaproteobacteria bacterium]
MRTILLLIEYDGTDFAGWQLQPNGRSVQEVVEGALAALLGEPVRLHSAGRTDAGVHACAMPAHFTTARELPLRAFRDGVNRLLPPDVAVREACEMPDGFHARFQAAGKWYRYTIDRRSVRSPLAARRSWQVRGRLDLAAMREAAALLAGEHDFAAFRTSGCAARTTVRRLDRLDLVEEESFLHIDVRGSGFLRNMVRMLAGTLVEIGLGKRPAADIARLLAREQGVRTGATAPPQGLCLMAVDYPDSFQKSV